MVSDLAKSIQLDMDDAVENWEVIQYPPNYKSITDTFKISNFRRNDFQIQLLNEFKSIKTLTLKYSPTLKYSRIDENSGLKINLPQLQSLKIDDMRLLSNFSGLK
jgi:hypothetical protein